MPFARCHVDVNASGCDLYDSGFSRRIETPLTRPKIARPRFVFLRRLSLSLFLSPSLRLFLTFHRRTARNENELHYIFIGFQFPVRQIGWHDKKIRNMWTILILIFSSLCSRVLYFNHSSGFFD